MSEVSITSEDPHMEHDLKGHKKEIFALAFHPNLKQLASCGSDNSVMLWLNLTSTNVRCYDFKSHTDVVTSVEFSSTGQLMATGSQDQTVRFWIPTLRGGSTSFRAHGAAIRTIAFSPDDETLLTGSNDKSVKVWNVQHRRFLRSFLGHTNWVRCVQFSPDGKIVASCADDKTMKTWDILSNQCIHTFVTSKGSGNYLAFHRSGNSVAVALNYGTIRVYDIRNNKTQQLYDLHDNAKCVVWHPYANYLLSCGLDGCLKIIDIMEGRPLYTLQGHRGGVNAVRFSTDGEYFASAGVNKHVMVWKTNFIATQAASSLMSSESQTSNTLTG